MENNLHIIQKKDTKIH